MSHDTTTSFFSAAGDLARGLLERLKLEDGEAYSAVSAAIQRGGFLTLHVAFGNAGLIDTRLVLFGPDGQRVTLMSLDDAESLAH